ncbi:hypothetical protein B0T26DRAFT_641949 [Lasiosphaeria miniovina]|uniref:PHD-type domain-containing protein n=1 Tax=Lasiosphaeria miniovina TaxID=1954250 RepID=A0AA40AUQ7_9PEZI|nr:uncharacterized protein B0T26DRAFT_641949 [Lasiosphaeria miniovina]KAK0722319.1 hypothetical protein B0T26DRAFT_641949 [Lasiosphaeria miniovina]
MPATTISSSTRATRSRYSSPQHTPNGTAAPSRAPSSAPSAGAGPDGSRAFMHRWLEPPVQVKASYQDAGLMRHGVVENMAPLGTMPKVGIFKKAPPPPPEHTPIRIILKRPAATPSTPVAAVTPAVAASAPEEDETEEEGEDYDQSGDEDDDDDGVVDDDDDDEEEFQMDMNRARDARGAAAIAASRRSLGSRNADNEWAPGKSSPQKGFDPRRSTSRTSGGARLGSFSSIQQSPTTTATSRIADLRERTERVVEVAVDEAIVYFRYPTAWALRTLYDENCANQEFLIMIEKVFLQTADSSTVKEFARLIQAKKKEGKKDNKGCYYFVPPSTNSRFAPRKAKRAPYGSLVKLDISWLRLNRDSREPRDRDRDHDNGRKYGESPSKQPHREPSRDPSADTEKEAGPEASPAFVQEPVQQQPVQESAREPEHEPKREPSPDPVQEQVQEPPREAHVRKKRRSNRHSGSASKMSAHGPNGKSKTDSPLRRRTRNNSMSSSSSLSSARSMTPPASIQAEDEEDEGTTVDRSPSRASPTPETKGSTNAAGRKPINKRRRSQPARKNGNVSNAQPRPTVSASRRSTAATEQAAAAPEATETGDAAVMEQQPYDMPAVVDAPLFPHLNSMKKGGRSGSQGVSFPSKVGRIDENDAKLRLRQSAKKVTAGVDTLVTESYTRIPAHMDEPKLDFEEQTSASASASASTFASASQLPRSSLPPARHTPVASTARSTRSSRKRSHDELDEQPSPTTAHFPASEMASTAANSRAGTPALRTVKRPRTGGVRVKTSPMKKKSGTSAGIPRASGERNSPSGNGAGSKEDDNDDYCSSCGGNGELVCCDGCTRSFHFSCVDPPLRQDSMPADWFCNVCRTARDSASLPIHTGALALLLERLDAKNSSAFRLPDHVRDYFEGVQTGVDGEYEETPTVTKPGKYVKKAEEEPVPDFFRLRDADGNAVVCHNCQKSSSSNRAIIPCSLCGLFWHLDCLDPPLANPPVLRTWRCPCHIDDLLARLPGALGPAHRFRKIKGAPVIEPTFSRGYVNNGHIEVELDASEDESGWRDVETYGKTVRLSEKGIKLDFLSRIPQLRAPTPELAISPVQPMQPMQPMQLSLNTWTLDEQQAAHNLAQLSGQGAAPITTLVDTLLAQAPPSVIGLMARTNTQHVQNGSLTNIDEQSLRAMLVYMEHMRQEIKQVLSTAAPNGQAAETTSSLANSQATDAASEKTIMVESERQAAKAGFRKNLPSPAATDDVLPTTREAGQKKNTEADPGPPALAEDSSEPEDAGLPLTPSKDTGDRGRDDGIVLEPRSDKTVVDDNAMDLD